jgi:flavin-binding protein dodecin
MALLRKPIFRQVNGTGCRLRGFRFSISVGIQNVRDDNVYRSVELTGSSETSIEDAIHTAIARANESLKHIRWFQVLETRGHVEEGRVAHYQVTIKVGFTLED